MIDHLDILDEAHVSLVASAIADGRIGLAVQDIHAADDPDQILYKECLVRLTGLDGKLCGSAEFVPCLEVLGEASTLDRHMLGLVLDRLEADPHAVLGCNITADSFLDEAVSEGILGYIRARPHLAPRLVLELAGKQSLQSLSFAAGVIADIRSHGCRMALDGFGDSYASPRLVQLVDFDIIKIDKVFIQDNRRSADDHDSLGHLAGFASCFAPIVVIEGVETKPQTALARSAGATHVQGNFVSFPVVGSGQVPAKAEDVA